MISNKSDMYRLLAAGAFGNTIPQYFDVAAWAASPDSRRYQWWGVRSVVPGGPCMLNCPREGVPQFAGHIKRQGYGYNISVMIDRILTVTLWGEVWDSPRGLLVYGIEYPPHGGSWRALMPSQGRHWEGTAARLLLAKHLNANSLDDLAVLRDAYPGHIYEFSCAEQCFGTVPGRNAIMWEVRAY